MWREPAQHHLSLWLGNIHKHPFPIKTGEAGSNHSLAFHGLFHMLFHPALVAANELALHRCHLGFRSLCVFDHNTKRKISSSQCRLLSVQTLSDISQEVSSFMASATTPWPDSSFKLLLKIDQGLSKQRPKKHLANAKASATDKVISGETSTSTSSVSKRKAHALFTISSYSQTIKPLKKPNTMTGTFSYDQRISTMTLCNTRPIHRTNLTDNKNTGSLCTS